MLAHGFTIELLVELVRVGLATATAERVVAGATRSIGLTVSQHGPVTLVKSIRAPFSAPPGGAG